MFDKEKFIKEFVEAAKSVDQDKMNELAKSVSQESSSFRIQLLEELVPALKEGEAEAEIVEGIEAILSLMKLAAEQQDSAGESAKDVESKAEEATQDVADDTSADSETQETHASEPESGGYAPAKEEEEGKSEDK